MEHDDHATMVADRSALLDRFFMPLEGTVSAREYFETTFVQPPGFDELVRALESSAERFILLEGQGRAGKTWTAVAAIAELLNKRVVDVACTAGEDSYKIYEGSPFLGGEGGGSSQTVAEGLSTLRHHIEESLEPVASRSGILLLDDFFGTSWLRTLGHEDDYPLLSSLLFGSQDNDGFLGWLTRLNLKMLLTGRSSVLATAAITLGRRPVELHEHFLSFPRGVFARKDLERDLTDTDEEWLREVEQVHRRFRTFHPEFSMPAIAALLPGADRGEILRPHDSLFGDDLRELSYRVDALQERGNAGPSEDEIHEDLERQRTELDRMYLLYLAPALMFPAHGVEALVGGREEALALRFALKLTTEPSGELAHRVPNGLYLRAVREHVRSSKALALLAGTLRRERERILARITSKEEVGSEHDRFYHWSVALRGGLEAALEFEDFRVCKAVDQAREKMEICPQMVALAAESEDVLLHLLATVLSGSNGGNTHDDLEAMVLRYPGLASSVGWLMARFQHVRSVVASGERTLVDRVSSCLELALGEKVVSGERSDWWPASFSSLLRWVAEFDREPHDASILGRLFGCYLRTRRKGRESLVGFGDQIAMVAEDALIWADCLPEPVKVSKLEAATRLREELILDIESGRDRRRDYRSRWRITNRLFSLAWHNEWQEHSDTFFAGELTEWSRVLSRSALAFAREDPTLIDANLRYHWIHMISQWAVWTRDWCFQDDPLEYERNRAATGCQDSEGNSFIEELLIMMLSSAIDGDGFQERARNASFLLGTRVSRCPHPERFVEAIRVLSDGIGDRRSERFIRAGGGVLQGIWELGRQGYLVRVTVGGHFVPNGVRDEIKEFIRLTHSTLERDELWSDYRDDLRRNTYLEGVPTCPEDVEL